MAIVIEKTGKTVEDAIQAAIDELGVEAEKIDVEVLELPAKRLFGLLGETPAKIRATLKETPAEVSAVEEKSSVVAESAPVEEKSSVVAESAPVEEKSSAVEKSAPVEEKSSAVEKSAPVEEKSSVVEESAPVEEKSSAVEESAPVEEKSSVVEESAPVEEKSSAVEKSAPVEEKSSAVEKSAPVEEKSSVVEESAPVEEIIEPVLAPSPAEENFDDEALDKAKNFLHDVFNAMNLNIEIDVTEIDDGYLFDLSGKGLGVLIGRHGQALDSLQYLLNLAANRHDADEKIHFTLDVEGYRDRRADALEKLAQNMADRAIKSRRDVRLEPMNRHERKVIHTTLQDNDRVETHSAGTEPYRYVIITPTKRGRR